MPSSAARTTSASTSAETRLAEHVEGVERPEPGIARGHWEAPAWIFWAVAAAALAGGFAWIALAIARARRTPR